MKFVSFVELSDDVDELLELLSQAESLRTQAENELKLRDSEKRLIKDKLKKLRGEQKALRVSDHAIVRYLERCIGIDVEACKAEMLLKVPYDELFSNYEPVFSALSEDNKLQFVIRDNLIVSVTPINNKEDK